MNEKKSNISIVVDCPCGNKQVIELPQRIYALSVEAVITDFKCVEGEYGIWFCDIDCMTEYYNVANDKSEALSATELNRGATL